jgi:hypothetical protein
MLDDKVRKLLLERLTVSVETAGRAFGIGRNAAYSAVKLGDIPSVKIGGRIAVPTAPVRKMLGLPERAEDGKAA